MELAGPVIRVDASTLLAPQYHDCCESFPRDQIVLLHLARCSLVLTLDNNLSPHSFISRQQRRLRPIVTPTGDLMTAGTNCFAHLSVCLPASETAFRWESDAWPDVPCSFPAFGPSACVTYCRRRRVYLRHRVICKTLSSCVIPHYVVFLGYGHVEYHLVRTHSLDVDTTRYYIIALPMSPGPGKVSRHFHCYSMVLT